MSTSPFDAARCPAHVARLVRQETGGLTPERWTFECGCVATIQPPDGLPIAPFPMRREEAFGRAMEMLQGFPTAVYVSDIIALARFLCEADADNGSKP